MPPSPPWALRRVGCEHMVGVTSLLPAGGAGHPSASKFFNSSWCAHSCTTLLTPTHSMQRRAAPRGTPPSPFSITHHPTLLTPPPQCRRPSGARQGQGGLHLAGGGGGHRGRGAGSHGCAPLGAHPWGETYLHKGLRPCCSAEQCARRQGSAPVTRSSCPALARSRTLTARASNKLGCPLLH